MRRLIFYINFPICAVSLLAVPLLYRETAANGGKHNDEQSISFQVILSAADYSWVVQPFFDWSYLGRRPV